MPTPEWAVGLTWVCSCGGMFSDEWGRDMCQREHLEDRAACRR